MTDAPSTLAPLRLALWQAPQHSADVAGNLDRLERTAREARAGGADLLVTPEMFTTGYCIDAPAVQRLAEPADGPISQRVSAIAADAGIGIVYGFAERAPDGRVFNAAQFVDAHGVRQGVYRKTHLFGGLDRANYSASDGSGPVFEINGWRFGCLICYDAEFPEAVRQVALRGADVVVVPTANMMGFDAVCLLLMPARAYENQCFVAYANCCGSEGRLDYCGTSVVAAPDGTLLAQAARDETLLYATLDAAHPGRTLNTYLADRLPGTYAALVA